MEQIVTATLTMNDTNSSAWEVELFDSQVTVLDCFPDVSWLDSANATSIAVLDSPGFITVSIDPTAIPTACPSLDSWIIEFPDGNPYEEYLSLAIDGANFTLNVSDASMPIGDYVIYLQIVN